MNSLYIQTSRAAWTALPHLARPLSVLAAPRFAHILKSAHALVTQRLQRGLRAVSAAPASNNATSLDTYDIDVQHHEHPHTVTTKFPSHCTIQSGEWEPLPIMTDVYDDKFPEIQEEVGYVHSTESFSAVDGPGMRFLIFLQGCGFRCSFCSNPDTWAVNKGAQMSSKDIAHRLDLVLPYLKASGGGVTCSGGEALLQPHFVSAVFDEARARGLNTCLDTTGQGTKHRSWDVVLPHTDLVLFCVKHMDPQKYLQLTGHPQGGMIKFARELSDRNLPAWCRYVLIPGMTDSVNDLQMLIDFLKEHPNFLGVELLPYHRLGVEKWHVMGLEYPLEHCRTPTLQQTQGALRQLEDAGIRVMCDVPSR